MLIIGLTGGIATGKSTVASMLNEYGVPIHDADAAVHDLLGVNGDAVTKIAETFGDDILHPTGAVDRAALGSLVFSDSEKRRQLEQILHPLVALSRDHFIKTQSEIGASFVVLDVPLLFETGGDSMCDYVIVVHAGQDAQYQRAIARPTMTAAKLDGILATQMPMAKKIALADFVLSTDTPLAETRQALKRWMESDLITLLEQHVCGDDLNA